MKSEKSGKIKNEEIRRDSYFGEGIH